MNPRERDYETRSITRLGDPGFHSYNKLGFLKLNFFSPVITISAKRLCFVNVIPHTKTLADLSFATPAHRAKPLSNPKNLELLACIFPFLPTSQGVSCFQKPRA